MIGAAFDDMTYRLCYLMPGQKTITHTADFVCSVAERIRTDAAEIERLRAERDALREIILGAGVNLWDKAEISDRDEAGNPTIILWHPSGMPLLRLSIESHAPHLEAAHLELVMSDLGDVFNARAALALLRKGDSHG